MGPCLLQLPCKDSSEDAVGAEMRAPGCDTGLLLPDAFGTCCVPLPLRMLLAFGCLSISQHRLTVGSLSQAALLLVWSVTASASGRVPTAVHFLNSGRKQSGRAGAAGQQGSLEETCSPAAGRMRCLPGRGGRPVPCLTQGG